MTTATIIPAEGRPFTDAKGHQIPHIWRSGSSLNFYAWVPTHAPEGLGLEVTVSNDREPSSDVPEVAATCRDGAGIFIKTWDTTADFLEWLARLACGPVHRLNTAPAGRPPEPHQVETHITL